MFIKSLTIENFKGFHSTHDLSFNMPDGIHEGSGLNIFIGENNSGKSTIFEALDFLKDSSRKEPSLIVNKSDPNIQLNDFSVEVTYVGNISDVVNNYVQANKINSFTNAIFQCQNNVEHFRVKRQWNQATPNDIKTINFWNNTQQNYSNPSGIDAPFKKIYDNNFIWADTNPSDEAKFGASTICGSLLKEIAIGHSSTPEYEAFQSNYHNLFNNPTSDLRVKISEIEQQIQTVFSSQFGDANISFRFEELQIDNFFKTANIVIDDGVEVPMNEKGHGMQRAVALSLLQVYAELTSTANNTTISKPFYLFIDEPEICLHPMGQKKLLDAIMLISKTKQVFITTHSPFILSSTEIRNAGLFILKKINNQNTIEAVNTSPLFPWSPSWGEISYKAYNLPTVELHNELYGYLQELNNLYNNVKVDQWLSAQGIALDKTWIRENKGIVQNPESTTLQTFIRNHVHHPENVTMQANKYTESELKQSIEQMINLVEQLNVTQAEIETTI
ncbi:ATPase AAA domain-containing protein [Vitreoscilla sp. C1]|uniref:ATP-dependent nuclease n=1 Tax=Vitreoscilla sp. (strain C1) TaxID=96942 RepID=UPI00148ED413|nr:AAA family ATPase [Vitreoscilla sp. C1]AUZ05438.2 ATPase AAA domain-containing protein [Vitreoscilla sp. C1]